MKVKIAFSGSGFLGVIHIGAVCAFLDKGIEIVEVSGTSGGSIVASGVALGKSSEEMKKLAMQGLPSGIAGFQILSLFDEGLNTGKILLAWLHSLFGNAKFNDARIPLSIMATDINRGMPYQFSKILTPDSNIAQACRASSSVPFFYTPYTVNNVKLVDGGCCCNIPVDKLCDDGTRRFGINVIDGDTNGVTDTFLTLAKQCLSTMLNANENNVIAWAQQTNAEIISISANPYGFLNANLTIDQKKDLFDRGYNAVINHLKS